MNIKEVLFDLLNAPGVSGAENDAAEVAARYLSAYMPVRRDALGSVIGELDGSGDGVLLDAHLDQIGLIVTAVTDEGFVKVNRCGGVDRRTLSCQEVLIHGKEDVYGVVVSTPPHLSGGENDVPKWETISIDTGLTGEKAKALIPVGCRAQFSAKPREMLHGRVCGAAVDDRAGVAALLRAVDILKEKHVQKKLTVVFSVQEEVTGGGARTAAFQSDDASAITVDVSFGSAPGLSAVQSRPLGKGTMIGIAPSLSSDVSERLQVLAAENDIPFQTEIMSGGTGTNAENYGFAKCGKRTGLLSVPIRNMHSAVEVVDLRDIESTAQLLAAYVEKDGEAE